MQNIKKHFFLTVFTISFHAHSMQRYDLVDNKKLSWPHAKEKFNDRRFNTNIVEGHVIVLGVGTVDFEIVNLESGTITQCRRKKNDGKDPYSEFCLFNSSSPLAAHDNTIDYYQLSDKYEKLECWELWGNPLINVYELELRKKIENVFGNNEKIFKIDRTELYVVAVSSKGSVATWLIEKNDIDECSKWLYNNTDNNNNVFSMALDKRNELLFLGLDQGEIAWHKLHTNNENPKHKVVFNPESTVTCIDTHDNKLVFGGDAESVFGTLNVSDLLNDKDVEIRIIKRDQTNSKDKKSYTTDLFLLLNDRVFIQEKKITLFGEYINYIRKLFNDNEKNEIVKQGYGEEVFFASEERDHFYSIKLAMGSGNGCFQWLSEVARYGSLGSGASLFQKIKVAIQQNWLMHPYASSIFYGALAAVILAAIRVKVHAV